LRGGQVEALVVEFEMGISCGAHDEKCGSTRCCPDFGSERLGRGRGADPITLYILSMLHAPMHPPYQPNPTPHELL
jgi:hypothetical protein